MTDCCAEDQTVGRLTAEVLGCKSAQDLLMENLAQCGQDPCAVGDVVVGEGQKQDTGPTPLYLEHGKAQAAAQECLYPFLTLNFP